MAYIKTDWQDGDVITEAGLDHLETGVYNNSVAIGDLSELDTTAKANLVAAINEAAQSGGGGGGLSNSVKAALLQLASKVAYIDEDGQDYYDDLYNALYPGAELVSINADYTQSGAVYPTTSLEDLRNDLVVNAIYDNGSVVPVISYTLSGTLEEGTSTITVTYEGFTDTFDVTVSAVPTVSSISAIYTQSGTVYPTDSLDSLKSDLVVTATYSDTTTATVPSADYTLSGTLTAGTSTVTVTFAEKTTTFNVAVTTGFRILYTPADGKFTEQTFIYEATGELAITETLSSDYTNISYPISSSGYPYKVYKFSNAAFTSYARLTVRFRFASSAYTTTNLGNVQFRVSDGEKGMNVGFAKYSNAATGVCPRYKVGTTDTVSNQNSFAMNEWHTLVATFENGKQTIVVDETTIVTNANPATQYTTYSAVYFSAISSGDVNVDISSYELIGE